VSTVVLLGSLGATTDMWEPQLAALHDHDVVRLDHPGHGAEPMIELRDVRDLVEHVLAHVRADVFSFVGLSLGGAVGMQLALDAPDRVDRLVLACTGPRFGGPEVWDERIRLVRSGGMAAVADVLLPRWFTPAFGDVQRFRAMVLAIPPETYERYCELLRMLDLGDEIGGIRAPALAIAGSDDPTSPPDTVEAMAAALPDARVVTIERAAHLANVERPDEFNRALLAHLS
jgi:3-oxoadipate enol-lactonase